MSDHWKQKRSAIRHYDQTAKIYEQQYVQEQSIKMTVALEVLPQPVDENAVVLDAGSGAGIFFPHIAQKAKRTIGIDTSANLLDKAKAKTRACRKAALIRADADFLPFRAETFTHAFAFTLLQNMPNPKNTMGEIERVTRRDATLVITGLKKYFTKTAFVKLLGDVQLEILILKTDKELKDFVAICRRHL